MYLPAVRWIAALGAAAVVLLAVGTLLPRTIERDRPALVARESAVAAFDYLRKARAEADPAYLVPARRLLTRSLAFQPQDNFAATMGMAAFSNATHDFSASVTWARRAIAINPYHPGPHGLLGDALFELGRVRAADTAYQDMIDLRPDVGSYVRISYAAQYHGNYDAAIDALELAIKAAPVVGEEAAWLRHQLGDVYAGLGEFARSERVNRRGIKLAPGYVPPTVGVAESYIARGRYEDALPLMENAVENLPALEYFVTLGDLYWIIGDRHAARATYDRAADRFALHRYSGVLPDHDFVQFYVDHGYRSGAALRDARYIYRDRPTPAAADTLAWALHAAGRDRAAFRFVTAAIERADTPDATQYFHAAVISDALGHDSARSYARRALRLDPALSLFHLREARRLAR